MTGYEIDNFRAIIRILKTYPDGHTVYSFYYGTNTPPGQILTTNQLRRYLRTLGKLGLVTKRRLGRYVLWIWDPSGQGEPQ